MLLLGVLLLLGWGGLLLLLLLVLLLGLEGSGKVGLEVGVLDLWDRDAHVWDRVDVCEDGALSVFGDEDGCLKVGNVVAILDASDGVGDDGVVLFELRQAELEGGVLDGDVWDSCVGEGE